MQFIFLLRYRNNHVEFQLFFYTATATNVMFTIIYHARPICNNSPGNRLTEWGIFSPPSAAPFMAPKTRLPVVVRVKPTSK